MFVKQTRYKAKPTMLQYCEKEKVIFIHIVHAFPIDFEQIKKKMLLYEVILTVKCFILFSSFVNGLYVF